MQVVASSSYVPILLPQKHQKLVERVEVLILLVRGLQEQPWCNGVPSVGSAPGNLPAPPSQPELAEGPGGQRGKAAGT